MSEADTSAQPARSLGASARASLTWAGGFLMLRDLLQFITMLVLVRLLQPSDYGTAALAQSIVGLLSVVSFGTFVSHALQVRDPSDIDWSAHFTAAVVGNSALALLTLALAWVLSFTNRYAAAALPLAVLSLVFIVEIPATLRHRMLQVGHDWRRFRFLLISGALLGSLTGIGIAAFGGGVWALVVQPVVNGLPAALDLIFFAKWRPHLSWTWARYRATAHFGAARIASGLLIHGRRMVEQSMLAGTFDFVALGVFTRAVGLATLIAGRLGMVSIDALYPVITRAEPRSLQFRRYAGLVMRGVAWSTIPAACLLALTATDVTTLLYGPRWNDVIPLVPLASIGVGLGGMAAAATALLLANDEIKACFAVDVTAAVFGVALAALLVPSGMEIYLAGLVVHSLFILGLAAGLLILKGGIDRSGLAAAFLPAIIATLVSMGAIFALRITVGLSGIMPVRLVLEFVVFGVVYLAVLRIGFEGPLRELVDVVPAGNRLAAMLAFVPRVV